MTTLLVERGTLVEVGDAQLRAAYHPLYVDAHPDEAIAGMISELARSVCARCLVAERLDTGEEVLLWRCGENWSVSRHDPNYERQRRELGL